MSMPSWLQRKPLRSYKICICTAVLLRCNLWKRLRSTKAFHCGGDHDWINAWTIILNRRLPIIRLNVNIGWFAGRNARHFAKQICVYICVKLKQRPDYFTVLLYPLGGSVVVFSYSALNNLTHGLEKDLIDMWSNQFCLYINLGHMWALAFFH